MKTKVAARIERLREKMTRQKIDTFLVLIQENRRYLSGYTGEDTQFDESAGALIISQKSLALATDSRFELQAKAEAPLYDLVIYQKGLARELPAILSRFKTKRLGIEGLRMSYNFYVKLGEELKAQDLDIEISDTSHLMEELRVVKDDEEINAIKRAVEIAEKDFQNFIKNLKHGMKESDAAWDLEKGCDPLAPRPSHFLLYPLLAKTAPCPTPFPAIGH
ncbi:MAG: aminopeptidase P family protein [Desulfobacterales bacterium]